MAKIHSPLGPHQIISVRLDEIVEQDPFTAELLASEQYETDVAVDLTCWDPTFSWYQVSANSLKGAVFIAGAGSTEAATPGMDDALIRSSEPSRNLATFRLLGK